MDLSFAVHNLAKFSSNPGKVRFEGLVNLLIYIREDKTLVLKYYAYMKDAPLSDLLIPDNINNKNQLVVFSVSSWKDCLDTGIIIVAYIILYQGGTIYHVTHVPRLAAKSGAESEYNAVYTAGMDLARLKMLIHEFLNNDPDVVPK